MFSPILRPCGNRQFHNDNFGRWITCKYSALLVRGIGLLLAVWVQVPHEKKAFASGSMSLCLTHVLKYVIKSTPSQDFQLSKTPLKAWLMVCSWKFGEEEPSLVDFWLLQCKCFQYNVNHPAKQDTSSLQVYQEMHFLKTKLSYALWHIWQILLEAFMRRIDPTTKSWPEANPPIRGSRKFLEWIDGDIGNKKWT